MAKSKPKPKQTKKQLDRFVTGPDEWKPIEPKD